MKKFKDLVAEGEKLYAEKYCELLAKIKDVKTRDEANAVVVEFAKYGFCSNTSEIKVNLIPQKFMNKWFEELTWFVSTNVINGVEMHAVCRVIDKNKPMHSGNVEFATSYTINKAQAQKIADELNHKSLSDEEFKECDGV